MNIDEIKVGNNFPVDVNVIIEVPAYSDPIKYEFDKKSQTIMVDRFIKTPMFYPCNYGFVPHTLSDDGDPIDVMVICDYKLIPGCVINVKPIGVLIMEDESGLDEKIIAVPSEKLDINYKNINEIDDIEESMLNKIKHFFEHYKDLESGKWVKVKKFESKKFALNIIEKSLVK